MSTIVLEPRVLEWARTRAGFDYATLALKVLGSEGSPEQVREWEETGELTFRRAELVAEKTHTPFGCLFLKEPPVEKLPIDDFRTIASAGIRKPGPDLLDVIYQCQQRQAWYRDYMIQLGAEPLEFIGTLNTEQPVRAAEEIRTRFKIGTIISSKAESWKENLSLHFEAAEAAGVLVMRSGVVGNNPHRPLQTDGDQGFHGFALSDRYAPLVFINSRHTLAAQLFTLVHEIAHLGLGESAVSKLAQANADTIEVERYCNTVAAETLVPMREFKSLWQRSSDPAAEARRLAAKYKVSTLVIAIRARDAGFFTEHNYRSFYAMEKARYQRGQQRKDTSEAKGHFHNTLGARAGNRFSRALIASTLEGRTTYKDAFRLLGIKSTATFQKFARVKYGYDFG